MYDSLKQAIDKINLKLGKGTIIDLKGSSNELRRVSSGCLSIDSILGGGWPLGRVCTLLGTESSGKSTLCIHTATEFQKLGHCVGYVDMEQALDINYCSDLGLDISSDKFVFSQPDCGEDALEVVGKLVEGGCKLVVLDSVAACVPRAELQGDFGESKVGLLARLMAQSMRKLVGIVGNTDSLLIFTNQWRKVIGGNLYGPSEVECGGESLKYASSIRVDMRRSGSIEKDKDNLSKSGKIKVKTLKNKTFPPYREVLVDIIFGQGISKERDIINLGTQYEIIQKKGSWFAYQGTNLAQGEDNTCQVLLDNPELYESIKKEIIKKM